MLFVQIVNDLPKQTQSIIQEIAHFAEKKNIKAYVVGGFVRDLLLKRESSDIDIVIEGDAVEFASEFCQNFHCKIKIHKQFKTANIFFYHNLEIDIITAREETYMHSGASPDIFPKTIKEDIARRDFSINTMALPIYSNGFGKLIDPFGGRQDLMNGTIRILHDKSFHDDPMRIYRAIRYLSRFDFKLDEHTYDLMLHSINEGVLYNLAKHRIKKELKKTLQEPNPLKNLLLLNKYHVLEYTQPSITIEGTVLELLHNIQYTALPQITLLSPEHKIEIWIVYLLGLIQHFPLQTARKFFIDHDFDKKISKYLYELYDSKDRDILYIVSAGKHVFNSRLYDALSPYSLETILVLMALAKEKKAKERIAYYIRNLRFIHPNLNGKDIQKELGLHPSPIVGDILNALWKSVLNGELITKKDEIVFIKTYWKQYKNQLKTKWLKSDRKGSKS